MTGGDVQGLYCPKPHGTVPTHYRRGPTIMCEATGLIIDVVLFGNLIGSST